MTIYYDPVNKIIKISKTKDAAAFQHRLSFIKSYGCRWNESAKVWHAPSFFSNDAFLAEAAARRIDIVQQNLTPQSNAPVPRSTNKSLAEEINEDLNALKNSLHSNDPKRSLHHYQLTEHKIRMFKQYAEQTMKEFEESLEMISTKIFEKISK